MEIHFKIAGFILIVLALMHVVFPRYFNWSKELQSLNLINRQMMLVHTFFIALTVLLMGLLCITSARDMIETDFGKKISFGIGIFWLIRMLIQFFGYSSILWKGKRLETWVHITFSIIWIYLSTIFLLVYFK